MAVRKITGTVEHRIDGKRYPAYREGYCACCGEALPEGQVKFCSDACCRRYVEEYPSMTYREKMTWNRVKKIVLERDGYACRECSKRGVEKKAEEVHHVVPIYLGGAEFDPGNCISVCSEHHKMLHRALPRARVQRPGGEGRLTKREMDEYWERLGDEK